MTEQIASPEFQSESIEDLLVEVGGTAVVREILDVVCQTTAMGFAAVAHVTETRWVACQVRDDIGFGLPAGGELPVKSTLCDTVRGTRNSIVIDHVAKDPIFHNHHTPATYKLQSYIAVPIILHTGEIFGTLCAIDPQPKRVNTPEIRGMFSLFAQLIATHVDRIRAERQSLSLELRVSDVLDERKVFADILERSPLAVTALDLDYRILAINRANADAFHRVYGKRPQPGDRFLSLFDDAPEYAEQQRVIWSRALAGESFVVVQEFGNARIERRSYEVRFNPLFNAKGERIGASSTSYDVTDRIQLAAAQEQLRHSQKLESLGQLTGGVAHDFNNLLVPIVGGLDILKRRKEIGDPERRIIDSAAISAERASNLVQRLLAFARRQPLQPRPVDIAMLVKDMTQLILSTVGPQIQLDIDVPDNLPPAYADTNQLDMALLNLCVNARDAMPQGGTLRVHAATETVTGSQVLGLTPGTYLRLTVADTGTGMDEVTLERATEPFFSTKGIGKGTGLGLSMVEGLARQLGGAVSIESQVGVGTQITIWLRPTAAPREAPDSRKVDPARADAVGHILLVDDDELVRESVAAMLMTLGYEVIETDSAEGALTHIRTVGCPDYVVTDHLMPGMTGAELVKVLGEECPHLPTLIITGYADAAGLPPHAALLTKPFRSTDLMASLARLRR